MGVLNACFNLLEIALSFFLIVSIVLIVPKCFRKNAHLFYLYSALFCFLTIFCYNTVVNYNINDWQEYMGLIAVILSYFGLYHILINKN